MGKLEEELFSCKVGCYLSRDNIVFGFSA